MVHSFGSSAPPFTTHSTAFESTIKREMGAAIDIDEVSLDMARYAQPDMEEAFADFLAKRLSAWQPDVVIPIGSPAGKFVAKFHDKLFPHTPVVYTGMDQRTLPAGSIGNNATFVGESFDLKGLIDDMLQLDPQTNHVVVILGASPLERYWTIQFQEAFKPFEGRVKFTWVNDLSFEQMLDVVSKLEPHSFVLLALLMRDAAGVTYNEDDALARLHAVSRAPINGMFQHEIGLGIVGGRLYQGELEGEESARIAARILRGEAASSIPPKVVGAAAPMYDWRELQRWQMSESRVPAGSVIKFREASGWERYRWQIAIAAAVMATQAMLLFGMFVQLRRRHVAEAARRVAEADAQQKREELAHLSRVAVLGELTATLTHEINQPLTAVLTNASVALDFLNAPQLDVEEIRAMLSDIVDDTTRASQVIRRLRAMLKSDTAVLEKVDVNDVVRSVQHIVRGDALLHRVSIELNLAPEALAVNGDAVQLQQVMLNLMLNAFSAMNTDGSPRRLIVRTSESAGADAGEGEGAGAGVLVEVQDEGHGIAADKVETIFDPFMTTKVDGLGMGLSICRSIIQRHGGKIWARNNAVRGATFAITLPLARA
jgi:signal transduction histidine kinase